MKRYKYFLCGILLVLFALILLRLWGRRDIQWSWVEETRINTGEIIRVQRSELREIKPGEPFQAVRGIQRTTLYFTAGDGNVPVVWTSTLRPMILSRGIGRVQWTVIASSIWCEDFRKYGAPRPPYIQFDLIDDKWTFHAVDSNWFDMRANLLVIESEMKSNDGQVLSHQEVDKLNRKFEISYRRYVKVDSKKISNCEDE